MISRDDIAREEELGKKFVSFYIHRSEKFAKNGPLNDRRRYQERMICASAASPVTSSPAARNAILWVEKSLKISDIKAMLFEYSALVFQSYSLKCY
jgi:hypothetical protein